MFPGALSRPQLKRYKDLAWLVLKYGRSDLVRKAGVRQALGEVAGRQAIDDDGPAGPKELACDLERLGPTYIKLGQLLSTQLQLLPAAYADALERLQDDVEPIGWDTIRAVVERELEAPVERLFSSFDREPVAAASLGQVHRALLPDGRPVAVKVQRPDITERIAQDFEALAQVARLVDRYDDRLELEDVIERSRVTLLEELDYTAEADHLQAIGRNLADFETIVVPRPVDELTTRRVLVMDWVDGVKVTSLDRGRREGLDTAHLTQQLFKAYLQQILVDGLFHADPHPGNVFLDGEGRIALIDLGMVGRTTPRLRAQLLQLVLAVSDGRGEEAADVAIEIGERREGFERGRFVRAIGDIVMRHQDASIERMQFGSVVLEIARTCAEQRIRAPDQLATIGKAFMNLDSVGRALAPDFAPGPVVRHYATWLLRRQLVQAASPTHVMERTVATRNLLETLPTRISNLLDTLVSDRLSFRIDAIDEDRLIRGLQKIANRIAAGCVLAALIVGAALLVRVETDATFLGYPLLAIVLFLAAALGGFVLVVQTLFFDE